MFSEVWRKEIPEPSSNSGGVTYKTAEGTHWEITGRIPHETLLGIL